MKQKYQQEDFEEVILERYTYDPALGTITSRTGRLKERSFVQGYKTIAVRAGNMRKVFYAHRIAWFLMLGWWPDKVDHINRDRADNRWENLREATSRQNILNTRRTKASGLPLGVTHYRRSLTKPFKAQMMVDGKNLHLGYFSTEEAAALAYKQAFITTHGEEWFPQ